MPLDDPKAMARFMDQVWELWIRPEITRRQQTGQLPANCGLWAAQVIMNFDKPVEVRLNEEVKAYLHAKAEDDRPVEIGDRVDLENDLERILDIELTELDPNAGHVTLLRHRGGWCVKFDFRYNAARVSEHISAASEFISGASMALENGMLRAFTEQLYAAVELMAKGELIMHYKSIYFSKKHGVISARYNMWGKLGNTSSEYPALLNRLTTLRRSARYLEGTFSLSTEEANEMLQTARSMLADLEKRVPKRPPAIF